MTEHILPCLCMSCQELAFADREISELESFLVSLKEKRSLIGGRVNRAHDGLVSKLPVEVISMIFTNFLPPNVKKNYGIAIDRPSTYYYRNRIVVTTTPLLLAAVCKAWRAIAWSTPQLWTSISVRLSHVTETHVDTVRKWLGRSGGHLPLYINLYADSEHYFPTQEEILKIVSSYSNRWFYLALDISSTSLDDLRSGFTNAHMLDTFMIFNGPVIDEMEPISLKLTPISTFSTSNLRIDKLCNIDWKNLTCVEASIPSIDICLKLFSEASFLTSCTFDVDLPIDEDDIPTTRDTILRHEHISFLHITDWSPSMDVVLSWMEFPALQRFGFDSSEALNSNLPSIADLFRRSGCSLNAIEVDTTYEEIGFQLHLIPFLEELPFLEILEIRRVDRSRDSTDDDYIDGLLTLLSATDMDHESPPNQPIFLPNLRKLSIKNMELSWECVLNLLLDLHLAHADDPTADMMAGCSEEAERLRCARPLCSLYVQLWEQGYGNINLDTTQRLQSAIEDLDSDGVQVTIVTQDFSNNFINILEKSLHHSEM